MPLVLVRVHGHGQCAHCGTNVEPCCSGAGDEVEADQSTRLEVSARVFAELFGELGGRDVSVAPEALVNAYCRAQGTDHEEALAVVAVAVRLGILTQHGPDAAHPTCYRLS